MKILFTGTGRVGTSWDIRGVELGAATGCSVRANASREDCLKHEAVVLVKRAREVLYGPIHASKRRLIWDVVDAWPQRDNRPFTREAALQWLRSALERVKPYAVVWPTQRMMDDAQWDGERQLVLRHHAWPKHHARTLREDVSVVGYEGNEGQLGGAWIRSLKKQCQERGWKFTLNGDMQAVDIGIALRSGSCYAARHWKSNVKLTNLHALHIPAICSPESGYLEVSNGTESWVETEKDLSSALDRFSNHGERLTAWNRSNPIELREVSDEYRAFLAACIS